MRLRNVLAVALVAALMLFLVGARRAPDALIIEATEDAYVVANLADEADFEGLKDRNLGDQDFTRAWYASRVVGTEQVIAMSLFKFDLSPLQGRAISAAHLQLYSTATNLKGPARLVDVHLIDGPWSQSNVTYNTRPPWQVNPISTAAVYGPNVWNSWDVTSGVVARANRTPTASFMVTLRALEDNSEEQVLFSSTESGVNPPRLVVAYDGGEALPWYYIAGAGGGAGLLIIAAFVLGKRMAARRRSEVGSVAETPT